MHKTQRLLSAALSFVRSRNVAGRQAGSRTSRIRRNTRTLRAFEQLESRLTLTAEGSAFTFDRLVDASGVAGPLTVEAVWGDGSRTAVPATQVPVSAAVRFQFDYSLDTSGFFNSQSRRDALEAAGRAISSSLTDSLAAIVPSDGNSWTPSILHPATGVKVGVGLTSVPAGVIYVYAGARDLPAGELARGGPGSVAARGTQAWIDIAMARGQTGARAATPTDFGPWGGVVAFDTLIDWYVGSADAGIAAGQHDFHTVAAHELFHLLGFGTAPSWNSLVVGNSFTGAASNAANAGINPSLADSWHWSSSLVNNGRTTLMRPDSPAGQRRLATRLDLAGLDDLGWDVAATSTRLVGTHVYADDGSYPVRLLLQGSTPGTIKVDLPPVVVSNVSPSVSAGGVYTAVLGQSLSVSKLGTFIDPGFGPNETFASRINWGDLTPEVAAVATIDQPGGVGVLTRGSVSASHVYTAAGTYRGSVLVSDDNGGASSAEFTVIVSLPPRLVLRTTVSSIAENAGPGAAFLTVQAFDFPQGQPITVSLASSDPSEARILPSITIPAGQTQVVVPIDAVDDSLLDGNVPVALTATASNLITSSVTIVVTDYETIRMDLSRSAVREDAGAGAATLKLTRSNSDIAQPLTVRLTSSDPSETRVPSVVIIPAGSSFVDVGVDAVDDIEVDGDQNVLLTAVAAGYTDAQSQIRITDYEPITTVASASGFTEGDLGSMTINLTVQLPQASSAIRIMLSASSPADVELPAYVDIPAGGRSVVIPVRLIDDSRVELTEQIVITAYAAGYVAGSVTLTAFDNDVAVYTNPVNSLDVNADNLVTPLDVLAIINSLNAFGIGSVGRIDSNDVGYIDVNGDGQLTPLDALAVINSVNATRRGRGV